VATLCYAGCRGATNIVSHTDKTILIGTEKTGYDVATLCYAGCRGDTNIASQTDKMILIRTERQVMTWLHYVMLSVMEPLI
jgi:hypothetical protein